ncbi:MAG: hypothetical protein ACKOAB_02890, partial [Polynucleobacter victoriensis]
KNNRKLFDLIDQSASSDFNLQQRCAILFAGLSTEIINAWCLKWGIPSECKDYALLSSEIHEAIGQGLTSAADILQILDRVDVWRKPDRFNELIMVTQLIGDPVDILVQSHVAAKKVNVADIAARFTQQGSGELIKTAIDDARRDAIKEVLV